MTTGNNPDCIKTSDIGKNKSRICKIWLKKKCKYANIYFEVWGEKGGFILIAAFFFQVMMRMLSEPMNAAKFTDPDDDQLSYAIRRIYWEI